MQKQRIIEALIIGLVLGAVIIFMWQFNKRLNTVENAAVENRKASVMIVDFINQQIKAAGQAQPQ